jgi:hypothetical protein
MGRACRDDLPDGESGIFLSGGLDDPNHVDLVQQIRVYAQGGKKGQGSFRATLATLLRKGRLSPPIADCASVIP